MNGSSIINGGKGNSTGNVITMLLFSPHDLMEPVTSET